MEALTLVCNEKTRVPTTALYREEYYLEHEHVLESVAVKVPRQMMMEDFWSVFMMGTFEIEATWEDETYRSLCGHRLYSIPYRVQDTGEAAYERKPRGPALLNRGGDEPVWCGAQVPGKSLVRLKIWFPGNGGVVEGLALQLLVRALGETEAEGHFWETCSLCSTRLHWFAHDNVEAEKISRPAMGRHLLASHECIGEGERCYACEHCGKVVFLNSHQDILDHLRTCNPKYWKEFMEDEGESLSGTPIYRLDWNDKQIAYPVIMTRKDLRLDHDQSS